MRRGLTTVVASVTVLALSATPASALGGLTSALAGTVTGVLDTTGSLVDGVADTTLDTTGALLDGLDPLLGGTQQLIGSLGDPAWSGLASLSEVTDEALAALQVDVLDPLLAAASLDGATLTDALADPLSYGWPSLLPPAPMGAHLPSVATDCKQGKVQCVDQVIREMTRRYERLGCDHDAAFAMTYLLTTEEYRRSVEDPHFFSDNAFLNHQDAVFAQVYFDAFDAWQRGQLEVVPPAWRLAFDTAERQAANGLGDVLLGMNAHIRRDLPFVLAAIGLVKPDGTSRKPDHDRVNVFLERVQGPLIAELERRHDPSVRATDVPGTELEEAAVFQAIQLWREEAWRKAELLVAAPTPEARERVARFIEQDATVSALAIRTLFATADPAPRATHCAAWLAGR